MWRWCAGKQKRNNSIHFVSLEKSTLKHLNMSSKVTEIWGRWIYTSPLSIPDFRFVFLGCIVCKLTHCIITFPACMNTSFYWFVYWLANNFNIICISLIVKIHKSFHYSSNIQCTYNIQTYSDVNFSLIVYLSFEF